MALRFLDLVTLPALAGLAWLPAALAAEPALDTRSEAESPPPVTSGKAPEVPGPPPLPPLELVRCEPAWLERIPALLELELSSLAAERTELPRGELHRLWVECSGERAELRAMLESGRGARTEVDLRGLSREARARSVALSAAELVDTLWQQELELEPAPPPPAAPTPAPRRRDPSLSLLGIARSAGRPSLWLGGLSLSGTLPIDRRFAVAVDATRLAGQRQLDEARATLASLSLAVSLLAELGGERWLFGVGPAGRVGWVRMRGRPEAGSGLVGDVADGPWGGPALVTRWGFVPRGSAWRLEARAEAGLVTLPVAGTRDRDTTLQELRGPWAGLGLGLGVSP